MIQAFGNFRTNLSLRQSAGIFPIPVSEEKQHRRYRIRIRDPMYLHRVNPKQA